MSSATSRRCRLSKRSRTLPPSICAICKSACNVVTIRSVSARTGDDRLLVRRKHCPFGQTPEQDGKALDRRPEVMRDIGRHLPQRGNRRFQEIRRPVHDHADLRQVIVGHGRGNAGLKAAGREILQHRADGIDPGARAAGRKQPGRPQRGQQADQEDRQEDPAPLDHLLAGFGDDQAGMSRRGRRVQDSCPPDHPP